MKKVFVALLVIGLLVFGLPLLSGPAPKPTVTRQPTQAVVPTTAQPDLPTIVPSTATPEPAPASSFQVPGEEIFKGSVRFRDHVWIVTEGESFEFTAVSELGKYQIPDWLLPQEYKGQKLYFARLFKKAHATAEVIPGVKLFTEDGKRLYEFKTDQDNGILTLTLYEPIQIFSARAFNIKYSKTESNWAAFGINDTDLLNTLSAHIDERVKQLAVVDQDPESGESLRNDEGKTAAEVAREVVPEVLKDILSGFYQGSTGKVPTIRVVIPDGPLTIRPDPEPVNAQTEEGQ